LDGRLGGTQTRSGRSGEDKSPSPAPFGHPARSLVTILTGYLCDELVLNVKGVGYHV